MFEGYQPEAFFDEMFFPDGTVRPHCAPLLERMSGLDQADFEARKATCELYFLKQGVTFNVYHDSRGSERIFPFDPVPRVIPAGEWDHLEAGLIQRITALNLFLHDIYHDQIILKDGIIPRDLIEQARHYRPEFRGMNVPGDIYIHICGSDLIRSDTGEWLVLEDNGRCPSGASYLLENRKALKRVFPDLFESSPVRPSIPTRSTCYPCCATSPRANPETRSASCSHRVATTARTSNTATSPARWASKSSKAATSSCSTTSSTCAPPAA
jgi:uncharacterized circularly permuted ATP-grasp superfamily protein